MDDDKGLDLSLGLPCGGSTSSKDKIANPAETRTNPDERTSKIVNEFKNFLNAGIPQSFQRTDPVKPQENFLNTIQSGNASGSGPGLLDKRKNIFNEMNCQKKQETEACSPDLPDKGKTSYISITTDEGSTGDNEDVAESEPEGSSSGTISHCEEGSRTPAGNGSSSKVVPKETHAKANVGPTFPLQPMNAMNVPYSITPKETSIFGASNTLDYPRVSMMHSIPCGIGEPPGLQITSNGQIPMTFGYSHVRVPMMDKDNPWGMVARPQSLHSPYAGRAVSASVPPQVTNPISPEPIHPNIRSTEQIKGQPKPPTGEEISTSQTEDNSRKQANTNSLPSDYPSIRPGISPDVKFGGSGSFPNLPWVSTTGPGPNGKTISGVTYKYNSTQVKIVCACHGTHMSPDEFIQHASEEQQPGTIATPSLASIPNGNPAASAKS